MHQPQIKIFSESTKPSEAIESPKLGTVGTVVELKELLETEGPQVPIAESPAMQRVVDCARRYARSSATVLVTGESGTGKELVAHFIHNCSARAGKPYVRVNCAALSESLIESELFGHERGAFTGAVQNRVGRIMAAEDGTLLLDEISEIPLRLQAKLLRVLEEQEFQCVGSNETHRVRARIIATSNRCLDDDVVNGRFREDLYYRINVLHLNVPPLRERKEDIAAMADFFLRTFHHEGIPPVGAFDERALEFLMNAKWPGNVRQLRNEIHRACVVCQTGTITVCDLTSVTSARRHTARQNFDEMSLDEVERCLILSRLRQNNGNKTAAARQLGITSRTLANKMKRYRDDGLIANGDRATEL